MNTIEVLARLTAHWPNLGGDGPEAEVRMRDWAAAVEKCSPKMRRMACDMLVTEWIGYGVPHIGDWNGLTQSDYEHERPALPPAPAEPTVSREKWAELVSSARATLADHERLRPVRTVKRVSKYDPPRPIELGEKHMTPEEREAELAAFGDRKVRTKAQR